MLGNANIASELNEIGKADIIFRAVALTHLVLDSNARAVGILIKSACSAWLN